MTTAADIILGGGRSTSSSTSSTSLPPLYEGPDPPAGYVPVPKTWFSDPFAMLNSIGLGYQQPRMDMGYETLRAMAEKDPIIAAIHQTRVHQVDSFCSPQPNKYSLGFRFVRRDRGDLTEDDVAEIRGLEDFILRTGADENPDRDDFSTYVKKIVRDRLTYDQMCTEIVPRYDRKPFEFFAAPAASIRIATNKSKKGTPFTREESQHLHKYVQLVQSTIVNRYTHDEMRFDVANPRSDIDIGGYGFSELEILIQTITAHLFAEQWNRKQFSQGATSKGILNVRGNLPPQDQEAFRRQWLAQISGASNAWKTPVMFGDTEVVWVPLQESNVDMGYESWMHYLISVGCAVYLIDPAEIGFDLRGGVAQRPMFQTTNEAQQEQSRDRGLRPLLRGTQKHINEGVVKRLTRKYLFEFAGLDSKSEEEAIELRMKELASFRTMNEVRKSEQLPDVEHGDKPMNPTYIGYLNAQQMVQAQGGEEGGMPGGPPPAQGTPSSESSPGTSSVIRFPDRFHGQDEADTWEMTRRSTEAPDLAKALEPLERLLAG